jgi:hypothetical protein
MAPPGLAAPNPQWGAGDGGHPPATPSVGGHLLAHSECGVHDELTRGRRPDIRGAWLPSALTATGFVGADASEPVSEFEERPGFPLTIAHT